ncbi:MAG: hypothetical protein Q4G69_06110 [Planctomycetia bacterium]|nr:hypothetical protein [Planctomycetia bacterium]
MKKEFTESYCLFSRFDAKRSFHEKTDKPNSLKDSVSSGSPDNFRIGRPMIRSMRILGFLLFFLLIPFFSTGCGPSRRQYAINEALLIDQTRLLENEVYRTRYQLDKALEENEQLRSELGSGAGRKKLSTPNLDRKSKPVAPAPPENISLQEKETPIQKMRAENNEELPDRIMRPVSSPKSPPIPGALPGNSLQLPDSRTKGQQKTNSVGAGITNPVYQRNSGQALHSVNQTGYYYPKQSGEDLEDLKDGVQWSPLER